jgi:hypothetical protein
MANRDDYRGFRGDPGRGQGRPEGRGVAGEDRAFDDRGRFNSDQARYAGGPRGSEGELEPWRRDRYGSRFDQDRVDYGSGYDRDGGGYGQGQGDDAASYGGGYGGQEYGMESHGGDHRGGGAQARPQDQARGSPGGQEFDGAYLRWREEQLRTHDRDYQDWRRYQQEQHDEEYRRFRAERRDTFGRKFLDWREQRTPAAGTGAPEAAQTPTPTAAPPAAAETQAYAGRSAIAGGGAQAGASAGSQAGGAEFNKEPPAVQATSDGADGRGHADRKDRRDDRR